MSSDAPHAPASLREFQQALTERLRLASPLTMSDARLGVLVADRHFLLPLEQVGEILPLPALTPVPLMPAWFLGLTNVRGRLINVLNLASFLDPAPESAPAAQVVLLADAVAGQCGLLVQQVVAMKRLQSLLPLPIPPALSAHHPQARPWLKARYQELADDHAGCPDPRLWQEIDIAQCLTSGLTSGFISGINSGINSGRSSASFSALGDSPGSSSKAL